MLKVRIGAGGNLLESLRSAGVYLPAVCGGRGACGKCAVRAAGGHLPVSDADRVRFSPQELAAGWRLACTAIPNGDITVEIPDGDERQFSIVNDFLPTGITEPPDQHTDQHNRLAAGSAEAAVAVDIGTTTLGFALLDMRGGTIMGKYSALNRQREFGGDVISRIQRANSGGLGELSQCIRGQIAEGIAALCQAAPSPVRRVAICGNTTMLHLLLGLSCETLGKAPFTPVTLELIKKNYTDIIGEGLSGETVILPGISTYVGADIAAGIYFTDMYRRTETVVLMDIGTNGEMALAHNGKILCAATAAGPAFEGGNILWGTGGIPGAISRVQWRNGRFEISTIGDLPPVGLCGSGVIDTVYQGLNSGMILPSGKFDTGVPAAGIFLAKAPDGRDMVFCQKDVRELQLAKSAIRTGLDALLDRAGIGYADVRRLYIAGGFGFNLNLESAAGIGLIPRELIPKTRLIGNSALGGAVKYLLNSGSENALRAIVRQSAECILPAEKYFGGAFIDNINF